GANASGSGGDDGRLTAEEASWCDLRRCELVTLSACDTGLGHPLLGESLAGLRRSLRLAGAAATLTSLWRIDDRVTERLMRDFCGRLWRGDGTPLSALREAQLALLEHNRKNHGGQALPGTWGAFVLEGASR